MHIIFTLFILLPLSTFAFQKLPNCISHDGSFSPPSSSVLAKPQFAQPRPDASEYIQKAMAATKEFGPNSAEARVAWETVEEISASTRMSDAMALGESLEECTVEATSSECIEYGAKLEELASLIAQTAPQVNRVKTLAADIKAIKLMAIDMPTGADSPAIRSALAAAKAATAVFGPTSSQAALAWEELEEIASAFEIAGALGGKLDDECLLDMMEACQALEELDRALGSN